MDLTKVPRIGYLSSPHSSFLEEGEKENPEEGGKENRNKATSLHVALMDEPLLWFRFDPFNPPEELVPCCPRVINAVLGIHFGFNFINCGSLAYGFGGGTGILGDVSGSCNIVVFDPNGVAAWKCTAGITGGDNNIPWELLPVKMKVSRFLPLLVVRDNLIYIMGSYIPIKGIPLDPWIEVFNTETNKLTSLCQPPDELRDDNACTGYASVFNNKIVITTDTNLFAYDCTLDKWEEVETRYPKCPQFIYTNVVAHGYMFSIYDGRLTAYNFDKDLHITRIPGFGNLFNPNGCAMGFHGAVIDLGDNTLCAVWVTNLIPTPKLHFCLFQVVSNEDGKPGSSPIRAKILSVKHYPTAAPALSHVFAL